MAHVAHIYRTKEQFLAALVDTPRAQRWGQRVWKQHIEKHGNVPMVQKCSVCSGQERKDDIKHGSFKPKRPSKRIRDEQDYQKGMSIDT